MFSITWCDTNVMHTVVGNADAVMMLYGILARRDGIRSIHIYACDSGIELNSETGLRDVVPQRT